MLIIAAALIMNESSIYVPQCPFQTRPLLYTSVQSLLSAWQPATPPLLSNRLSPLSSHPPTPPILPLSSHPPNPSNIPLSSLTYSLVLGLRGGGALLSPPALEDLCFFFSFLLLVLSPWWVAGGGVKGWYTMGAA